MKLNRAVPVKCPLWQSLLSILATVALAGISPGNLYGIGISPGTADVTLELGNTNVVPIDFVISFTPGDPQYIYWTTNEFAASELASSNLFFSFDPVERVTGFETSHIQGDSTNGQVVYSHTVYVASANTSTNLQEYEIDYLVLEWMTYTVGGGVIFLPGVTGEIFVNVISGPIASNQVVTTTEDVPVAISLSGLWQTGLTGTCTVVSQPAHGILGGTAPNLTYTPATNYAGSDSFTFKVNSGSGDSDPATVTITVNELNTAPVFFSLPDQTVFAGGSLNFNVATSPVRGLVREVFEGIGGSSVADLTNAYHFPDHPTSISLLTNSFASLGAEGQRLVGYLVPPVTGDYVFIASSGPALLYLATVEKPEDKVAIADATSRWPVQSAAVRLEAGEAYYAEALVVGEMTFQWHRLGSGTWEAIPASYFVAGPAAMDTDIPADVLTFELLSAPDGMSLDSASGLLTWTPTEMQVPSTNLVTVRVSDDGTPSLSATQSFTVFALPSKRLPILVVPPDQTIDEMTTLTLTNEASEAAYPSLLLSFSLAGAPAGASINPTNGVFTWTPADDQGPSTNLIRVVVTDDGFPSVCVTQSFSVVVREVNRPPVWPVQPNVRLREGDTLSLSLAASNGLLQEVWTAVGGNTLFDLTNNFAFPDHPTTWDILTNGFATPSRPVNHYGQRLRGFLVPPETGNYTFWLFSNDESLLYLSPDDQPSNKVAVAGWTTGFWQQESAPIGLQAGNRYYVEALHEKGDGDGDFLAVNWQGPGGLAEAPIPASRLVPLSSVRDPDWPANVLTYQLVSGPDGVNLDPATGELRWTPTGSQQPSTNVFVVAVSDNGTPSLSVTQTFTVVVSDAPELIVPETVTLDEMTMLALPVRVTDISVPPNMQTFELLSAPAGMSVDPASGVLTWTPTEAQGPGAYFVTLRVTDHGSPPRSDTESFTVIVREVNRAPVWTAVQNPTLVLDQTLDFSLVSPTNHGLVREIYAGIPGNLVADLTNAASFPDHPTSVGILTDSFAAPANVDDNYGQRIRGWVVPPLTGVYTFWTYSHDESLLLLSADAQPGNIVPIAGTVTCPPIRLLAGRAYYIEALMKAALGDDYLAVGWQLPNGTTEYPIPVSRFVLDPATAIVASEPDLPPNALSFELLCGPEGMSLEPATGRLTWTPSEAQAPGAYVVTIKALDDGLPNLSAMQSFTVFVRPPNPRAPTLEPIPDQALDELTTLTLTNLAAGADLGEQLTFWLLQAPLGASLNPTNGVFTWIPTESQGPSSNWITLVVSDDGVPSLSATQSFAVVVREVNSAPVWLPIPDQTVRAGETAQILPHGLLQEVYEGLAGQAVSDLTNQVSYPAHPVSTGIMTNLVARVGLEQGQRIRGYFAPPIDEIDSFECWGAESQVFLSTDEHQENKQLVWLAMDWGGTGLPRWPLEAGKLYYLEILSAAPDFGLQHPLPGEGFFAPAAIDADLPENLLRYELVSGPDGTSVDPYTGRVVWTPNPAQAPSTNIVTVKVSDNGMPSLSVTQSFRVVVLENHPPSISIAVPTNGTVFALGQTLGLEASAADVDGNLQSVEFFDGTNRLAEVASPPFHYLWLNAPPGTHLVSARALDRAGATASSDLVNIRVAGPPRLAVAETASGQQFRLLLTGEAGIQYGIEASTNLLDWVPLATNAVGALETLEFADLETTNFVQRFYRARQQPSIHTSVVWVDDALPAGAVACTTGGDSWNWVSGNPAPFSGSLASQSSLGAGEHTHCFSSATQTLTVNTGDVLFAYVYLDPNHLPSETMLQWNDGSWEHRAYWGANYITCGTDGTASRRHMGPLPAAGQWVCLEVSASQVGLEGSLLNGLGFTQCDGRATWDYAGKASP